MSDAIPPPPKVPMTDEELEAISIKRLILSVKDTLLEELSKHREQWQEAETTILARGRLHKQRLDEHEAALEELKSQFEHFAEGINARLDELERKTEPSPPPQVAE